MGRTGRDQEALVDSMAGTTRVLHPQHYLQPPGITLELWAGLDVDVVSVSMLMIRSLGNPILARNF